MSNDEYTRIRTKKSRVKKIEKVLKAKNLKNMDEALHHILIESIYFKKSEREIKFNEWIQELDDIAPYGVDGEILNNCKALLRSFVLNDGTIKPDILKLLSPEGYELVETEEGAVDKEHTEEELQERIKKIEEKEG